MGYLVGAILAILFATFVVLTMTLTTIIMQLDRLNKFQEQWGKTNGD